MRPALCAAPALLACCCLVLALWQVEAVVKQPFSLEQVGSRLLRMPCTFHRQSACVRECRLENDFSDFYLF